jgi:hypothetical protein
MSEIVIACCHGSTVAATNMEVVMISTAVACALWYLLGRKNTIVTTHIHPILIVPNNNSDDDEYEYYDESEEYGEEGYDEDEYDEEDADEEDEDDEGDGEDGQDGQDDEDEEVGATASPAAEDFDMLSQKASREGTPAVTEVSPTPAPPAGSAPGDAAAPQWW